MIYLNSITKSFGNINILNNITASLSAKRTALVGLNGSGKTTLLKIIAGIDESDSGEIISKKKITIDYLSQFSSYNFKGTVLEELLSYSKNIKLIMLKEEEHLLIEKIKETPENFDLIEKLSFIHSEILAEEILSNKSTSPEEILLNLGFSEEMLSRKAEHLSGGWQMRLALARILYKRPDIILLDEPTNYLDIETIQYLSDWLKNYEGQSIIVSHDRHFLNSTIEEIWEIFNGNIEIYKGNYDFYLLEKDKRIEFIYKQREKQLTELAKLQDFVDRNRTNAATASLAQSKLKLIDKLKEEILNLPEKPKILSFHFPEPLRSGNIVCEINKVGHNWGNGFLFKNFSRIVNRKERLALVGKNGIGKSTLMNIMAGLVEPSDGVVKLGANVEISYFRQNEIEFLPSEMSVIGFIESICPFDLYPKIKGILANFLFFEDSWDKKISILSGGEKVKLSFIKMMLRPKNLMLLDEPTTHLDINSKEILLKNLKNYEGTIIFVSHDIFFIDNLSTSIVYFKHNGDLINHSDNYSSYISTYGDEIIIAQKKEISDSKNIEKNIDWELQKTLRNKLNKLKKEIESIEAKMALIEDDKNIIIEKINAQTGNFAELGLSLQKLENEIETLYSSWEYKNLELEQLQLKSGAF